MVKMGSGTSKTPKMDTEACAHRPAPTKFLSPPLAAVVRWGICAFTLLLCSSVLYAQNEIQIENAKQGTTDWVATNLADAPNAYTNVIEGYASLTSVNRGGQITFYVNVTVPGDSYTINVYRMGWYGGLGARAVLSIGPLLGVQQPIPVPNSTTGLIECNWTPTYVLNLDSTTDPVSNWVSGVYVALLTDTTSGKQRYIVFVVRDDLRSSKYFFQCAVNTYQAYNNWGGKSLYAFDSVNSSPATKVSFNRPYGTSYGYDGSGDFITGWEYDAVRFLEREGYDITYGTDLDAHESPNLLLAHKAILIVGHNEYWSMAMRNNIIAARDQGVSLGIFAGNVCYWQVRFESSAITGAADRTMVAYKAFATSKKNPGPDPYYTACTHGTTADCPLVTVQWRQSPVNLPENAFIGIMWANDPVNGDIRVTNASNWVFNTTGLQNNSIMRGLLGYEVDSTYSNGLAPANLVTLAASPYTTTGSPPTSGVANTTVYTAASGATVFAAGTFQFSWGLDDFTLRPNGLVSFGAQQMTRNLLARFIGDLPPVANAGGPYTGATLQSVQYDGNASSDPDGAVDAYQWDFGDGTTGTGALSAHAYSQAGTYKVSLIVTDSEGSRNAATTTATITDQPLVSLAPPALSFGYQSLGTPTPSQFISVTNTGTASLTFSNFSASGDFAIAGSGTTCSTSSPLAVNGICTIAVTFTPSAAGPRKSAVVIADTAVGSPQAVILTGVGTAASLTPTSLTFTSQTVGIATAPQAINLTNLSSGPMNIWQITFLGANASDFSEISTCGSTLGAGASCTINVTFTPGEAGTRSASLLVSDDVGGSPQAVSMTGTGVAAAPSTSSGTSGGTNSVGISNGLSASELSFGKQKVGTSSSPQTTTFTNTRKTATTIRQISVSGTGQGDFELTTTCGARVEAGQSCTLQITFTPHVQGARKAVITIEDDDPGSPYQLLVQGVGVQP